MSEQTTITVRPISLIHLTPAPGTPASGRREYDCIFVQPGRVLQADGKESNWLLPAEVLQTAAPLFDSVSVYLDHPEECGFGFRQQPRVANLAGCTFDARWEQEAILGGIRLYDLEPGSPGCFVGALLDQIIADQAAGREVPPIGLSAVFWQKSRIDEASGLRVTTEIAKAESVDVVYSAGARGYVRAALAAQLPGGLESAGRYWNLGALAPQEAIMPEETTPAPAPGEEAPQEPQHIVDTQRALLEYQQLLAALQRDLDALQVQPIHYLDIAPGGASPAVEHQVARLSTAVDRLATLVAEREEPDVVQGMGVPPRAQDARSRIAVGPGSLEQVEIAFEALLAGVRPPDGIRPLTGIREMYHLLSGDYNMTGVFDRDAVYLANVTTSTMASIVANALNKRVMNEFQAYPQWWARAVTIEEFTSLQDVRWTMLGGVGELPTVAEGAAYTEMTWDDKYETNSFVKKGGYLGITIEAIDKDDTNRVRAAPRALAQAAWMTLGKSISAIFTTASGTGPTLVDTGVLFNATAVSSTGGHANLGTTALSQASWRSTKIAMMKQAELNSAERLGALTRPRLLWVPLDLEDTAVQILATEEDVGSADWAINVDAEGEGREERLRRARERVIVSPFWTDANDWAAQADPRLYPSIGLAFRYGRTPEIFSVADPTAGLMFTNDIMPVKVRFFFATGPIDFRGLYKHNVS